MADNPKKDSSEKKETKDASEKESTPSKKSTSNTPVDEMSDQEKIEALIQELSEKEPSGDDATGEDSDSKAKRIAGQIKGMVERAKKTPKDDAKDAPKKGSKSKQSKPKKRLLMIQLGGAFHGNFFVNLIFLYLVNLVVIIGLLEGLNLGQFPPEIWMPMTFVLIYTISEVLFKEFMVKRFSKWILMSFGFIFYFGYVILFYLVDVLIFFDDPIFAGAAELAVFTLLFMLVRQVMSIAIKKGLALKI